MQKIDLTAAEKRGLTEDGKTFAMWALDPCPDKGRDPVGVTDYDSTPTVPVVVTDEVTITAPGSTTWSAAVFTAPLGTRTDVGGGPTSPMAQCTRRYVSVKNTACNGGTNYDFVASALIDTQQGGAPNIVMGPLNVHTWTTSAFAGGKEAVPSGSANYVAPTSVTVLGQALPAGMATYRVVAQAIEIIDVTPELYAGGLLTAARTPCRTVDDTVPMVPEATPESGNWYNNLPVVTSHRATLPPASISAALQYSNTVQWPAKQGCYAVCSIDHGKNPLRTVENDYFKFMSSCAQTGVSNVSGWASSTVSRNVNSVAGYSQAASVHLVPVDNTIIYLDGLPPQGTYVVRLRRVLEIAPNPYDSNAALVPAARPSPAVDDIALEAIQRIARVMPPAVPFALNPAGEWTSAIVRSLGAVAASLAPVAMKLAPVVYEHFMGSRAAPRQEAARSSQTLVVPLTRRTLMAAAPRAVPKKKATLRVQVRASSASSRRSKGSRKQKQRGG